MNKVVELTDNELIQSFQDGNNHAFDALIDRYQEKIFNTILFMVKDSYLAEDLIQEIFIKIIDNLKQSGLNPLIFTPLKRDEKINSMVLADSPGPKDSKSVKKSHLTCLV